MASARATELGVTNMKVYQDDATEMKKSGTNFDVVLGCNLIDRLPDPMKWIELTKQKVSKDGIIIVCDPYTWLEDYTPKSKWLGGF